MPQNSTVEDDEIDLRELFAVLWFHKLLIIFLTSLSICIAGYNVLKSEKRFTASAIFQIEQGDSGTGFNISGDLGVQVSLAGISQGGKSNLSDLLERTTGREFIINLTDKFLIERDPFFNSYDPNYK